MAKRKQLFHPDDVKQKIQTSQLINRLHDHAFGRVELAPHQVRSIEILLRKAIPDLASVEHGGEIGVSTVSPVMLTGAEFEEQFVTEH